MPARAIQGSRRDYTGPDVEAGNRHASEFMPVFRAVGTPRGRRGIRLEAIYWEALRRLADTGDRSVGEEVELTAGGTPDQTNLASRLRVRVVRWLFERVRRLEALTGADTANAIVQASPSPAFALTADKRIAFYNPAFLHLIQSRFVEVKPDVMRRGLRLSLDTSLDQVIDSLTAGGAPVTTSGFVLGVEGQRIRGALNLMMAPVHAQPMVIAFVARA